MVLLDEEGLSDVQNNFFKAGFVFNPFEYLEASNDPYLPEYLIGHDMFAVAWETSPATIFAPAGGGKTAMRICTLRTCWFSGSQRKKFPVSYDLPVFSSSHDAASLESHKLALAAAASTDVLLACAYRPELYLGLPPEKRRVLLSLIEQGLPTNLFWSLSILEETASPRRLSEHLDRTYILPDPPSENQVTEFCRIMQADLDGGFEHEIPDLQLFDSLTEFITHELGFDSIFILLDGVDGLGNLAHDSDGQYRLIESLCDQASIWMTKRLFLKAFLPLELEALFQSRSRIFYKQALHARITWSIPDLTEILRRRVYVASRGKFGSLDALSSPALRDVETLIAQRAEPLPREAIVMAGNVLESYLARGGRYLEPRDIEYAEQQYHHRSVFPDSAKSQ